ncbi:MAG: hypothetical protein QM765_34780 [Myxococcales bacterium]
MRRAFGILMAAQSAMLALLVVGGASVMLPGLAKLPQALTASVLAVGLISVFPIQTRAWGVARVYGWLASLPIVRGWIGSHRPFQFAAGMLVLLVAAIERLPAWLRDAVPRVIAQYWADRANDGALKTLVVWTVAGQLGLLLFLLLLAFAIVVIASSFSPKLADRASAPNLAVLWNVLATGILVAAQAPDIFSGRAASPADGRWWLSLVFALEIARRLLVMSLLFAYERLGIALEGTLSAKVLGVRIRPGPTAVGLAATSLTFLVLERPLGVAGAASVVLLVSELMARALERLFPRARAVMPPAAAAS